MMMPIGTIPGIDPVLDSSYVPSYYLCREHRCSKMTESGKVCRDVVNQEGAVENAALRKRDNPDMDEVSWRLLSVGVILSVISLLPLPVATLPLPHQTGQRTRRS